jgi:hypothetical protein
LEIISSGEKTSVPRKPQRDHQQRDSDREVKREREVVQAMMILREPVERAKLEFVVASL